MPIKSFKPKLMLNQRSNENSENSFVQNPNQSQTQSHIPSGETHMMLSSQHQNLNARNQNKHQNNQSKQGKFKSLRLIPLGGVGDVTKNMYVYEYGDDILIVDCGIGFPEEDMLGIDLVIPDISYLKDKRNKIKGIVISHAHEDHIGSLPYLWPQLDCPIYAQPLPAGFIKAKFSEHKLPKDKIKEIKIDTELQLGVFKVSFYRTAHSVPDAAGIVIETPVGRIIHQSDFKLDWTPVSGEVMDVGKLAMEARKGVLLLLVDGLGIERNGYNQSERVIADTFTVIEEKTKGKMVVTTNSSNITRMQQLIDVAARSGRKVALSGRSMENNFQVAQEMGYLKVPPGIMIPQEEVKRFSDDQIMIIIAGSQGQPSSALSRAANYNHKFIQLKQGDSVVFSATPIPSSELAFYALVDRLTKMNLEVYYSDITSNIHVSGHAAAEEIKLVVNLAKPQFVMPIGSTIRGMKVFSKTMQAMGFKENEVILPDNGQVVEISQARVAINGKVEAKNVYVDGLGVGDVGNIVLRDRQVMAEEGTVIVVLPLDSQSGRLAGDIDIISRGFIFEQQAQDIIAEAKRVAASIFDRQTDSKLDQRFIRREVEEELEKYLYDVTQRRPMIVPIVVEV